jgi:hypothetical protein
MSERGSEVALFDYALGNQNILKNKSLIAVPKRNILDINVFNKFTQVFDICSYETYKELDDFIIINKIDLVYKITHGYNEENLLHKTIPHFIHCIFSTKYRHGTFFSPISPFLNRWYKTNYPVLPHIVKKFRGSTENLKESLSIPSDAVVFGSYGGSDSFNIPFVQKTILDISRSRKDIFFLFMNFNDFTNSNNNSNIIFLPKNTDVDFKEIFINTCDAMIHARNIGETFGLAIAEFSVKNKPIITWCPTMFRNTEFKLKTLAKYILGHDYWYADAHLEFLGNTAIRYSTEKDLRDILLNFKKKYLKDINYNCYSERFSEEKVMRTFENIYSMKIS